MCGRYALYSDIEQIKSQFPIDRVESEASPNYNVAPTQEVLAVIHQEGLNILGPGALLGEGYQDRQQDEGRQWSA